MYQFFQLKLHVDDRRLIEMVRNNLGLKEPVREYFHQNRHYAMLIVRKCVSLDQLVILAFRGRLHGLKRKQFEIWKERFEEEKANWKYCKSSVNPYKGSIEVR